jgi:hypothetical protein
VSAAHGRTGRCPTPRSASTGERRPLLARCLLPAPALALPVGSRPPSRSPTSPRAPTDERHAAGSSLRGLRRRREVATPPRPPRVVDCTDVPPCLRRARADHLEASRATTDTAAAPLPPPLCNTHSMTYSKTDKGRHRLRLSLHLTTSSSATATRDALFPPAGEPDSPAARPPRRRPSSYPSFSAMLPPDWQLPDDSPTLERPSAIITSPPSVPGPAGLPSPAHAKPSLTYKSRPEGFRLLTTATSKLRPLGSAILSSSGSRRRTSRTRTVIIALSTVALATLLLLATANDRPGLNFAFAVRETVDRLGCLGRHGRAQLLNAASGGDKSDAGRWATETNSWAETKILLHAPGLSHPLSPLSRVHRLSVD